jgi:hypothetical protein
MALGAFGDGITDDTAALIAAEAASDDVYIPYSSSFYVFTKVPDLAKCWGPGVCKVSGNRVYVRPTQETAKEIYADIFDLPLPPSDAGPALQRAIDYAQSKAVNLPLVLPPNGVFYSEQTLIIKQGAADLTDFNANGARKFRLIGNNCDIRNDVDDAALWIQPQATFANATTWGGIQFGLIRIENLTFHGTLSEASGYTSSFALRIGRAGYVLDEQNKHIFKNIKIAGYPVSTMTDPVLKITNTRSFVFDNLMIVDDGGMLIECADSQPLAFTGDASFNQCWFTGTTARRPVDIIGSDATGASSASCSAILFNGCWILSGGIRIFAGDLDWHRNITFRDCAFDTGDADERAVEVLAGTNGNIDRIAFENCDITAWSGNAYRVVNTGTGTINQIHIHGGQVFTVADASAVDVDAIYIEDVDQLAIRDVAFKDITVTNAAIYMKDSTHISVMGCTGDLAFAAGTDFVQIDDDATCNDWHIIGNAVSVNGGGAMVNLIAGAGGGTGLVANNQTTTT